MIFGQWSVTGESYNTNLPREYNSASVRDWAKNWRRSYFGDRQFNGVIFVSLLP